MNKTLFNCCRFKFKILLSSSEFMNDHTIIPYIKFHVPTFIGVVVVPIDDNDDGRTDGRNVEKHFFRFPKVMNRGNQ